MKNLHGKKLTKTKKAIEITLRIKPSDFENEPEQPEDENARGPPRAPYSEEMLTDRTMLQFKFSDVSDLFRRSQSGKLYDQNVKYDKNNYVPRKPRP